METLSQYQQRKKKELEEAKMKILNDPAPTEKFRMVYPSGVATKLITIYNGANKKVGEFPVTPNLRKIFGGRSSIIVKAKIIDGQFEMIKVFP